VNNFTDMPLLPEIQKNLAALGFTTPTEIQKIVIPTLIETKRDVHAQAQTGTGKTLAFGIPLIQTIDATNKSTQALVVAPTRELVLQIHESLKPICQGLGITIEPIYGGMSIERQMFNLRRGAHIVVGTPGRLNDHLRRKTMSLKDLSVLVLDEADIMLDMGFKEEVDEILTKTPSTRNIWLFSATVGTGIRQLINSHMHNVLTVKSEQKNTASKQVKQFFCVTSMQKRVDAVARFIESVPDFYSIIFCRTKMLTDDVTEALASRGFRVNCLHGDMKQTLRNQVIKGFKNKDFNVLVATDVAARGIDVSDLTHVMNFSIPDDSENYIHRIGRTGRAGKEGVAITFVTGSEIKRVKRIEREVNVTIQEIQVPACDDIVKIKMTAVSDFIEQSKKIENKYSAIHQQIKELINSFSEDEIRNAFALALEDKFLKGVATEQLGCIVPQNSTVPQDICLTVGKNLGFTEQIVRNYITATCKLQPQEIGKISVQSTKTFICIPQEKIKECIAHMQTTPLSQSKFRIYLVDALGHGKQSQDQGDSFERRHETKQRFGSRGGDRGGERRSGGRRDSRRSNDDSRSGGFRRRRRD
jgi:ATP-dependent RNA helicase DeaD